MTHGLQSIINRASLFAITMAFCLTATAAPQLLCTDRVYNFGTISSTNAIEHVFTLRNTGDSDLVIKTVRTCCGGTAHLKDSIIQPGKETTLETTLSLHERGGSVTKAYYVLSNDPNWPFYKLTFKGTILGTASTTVDAADAPVAAAPNPSTSTPAAPPQEIASKVIIDFFYEAGCPDCRKVQEQILPEIKERFSGLYDLRRHDVGTMSNVVMLVAYQEKLGIKEDKSVCMVVDYQHVFNGFDAIKLGLLAKVKTCIADRSQHGWKTPHPIETPVNAAGGGDMAENRMKSFTLPAVALAGLIDGLNPCAIGTLVFFMSLLTVFKIKASRLLLVGAVFCLASFITYTAIGYGLLRVLHGFAGFPIIQRSVEVLMTAILALFAFLSFRDAWRFHHGGKPGDVTLQLPKGIKDKIHRIMRGGLSAKSLVAGSLTIGVLVTALESVCTGQVYVPTLVLVLKTRQAVASGLLYLLLYNLMFIVPLVVAFVIAYRGLKTEAFIQWGIRNVVPSKILLGSLFMVMAALMWIM